MDRKRQRPNRSRRDQEEVARIHRIIIQENILMNRITVMVWSFTTDNLECEVKWVLGSIANNKASGCDKNFS